MTDEVYELMGLGCYTEAENLLRDNISTNNKTEIGDWYLLGELAVTNKNYSDAIPPLSKAVTNSILEKNAYYLNSSYLLRSYCYAKNFNKKAAQADLESVLAIDSDTSITWIYSEGDINAEVILALINGM